MKKYIFTIFNENNFLICILVLQESTCSHDFYVSLVKVITDSNLQPFLTPQGQQQIGQSIITTQMIAYSYNDIITDIQ